MKGTIKFTGRKQTFFLEGKEVSEAEFRAAFPRKIDPIIANAAPQNTLMQTSKAWPKRSDALGVHPSQKKEAEDQARRLGVATEFDGETGQAILNSSAHQRDLCKALGYHNRDGGYGQITG